jgi:hypothetical protein
MSTFFKELGPFPTVLVAAVSVAVATVVVCWSSTKNKTHYTL